ncbi:hypothetical protein [Streptomyces sp. NPDC090026]|uniref:hypothetical protein n=1 Tax=Streptomyces sp. NPDC090026 TaxID=3365923 RepID=UPI00380BDAD4
MPTTPDPPADPRRTYPGRPDLDAADSAFRAAIARLARDRDPATAARALPLVQLAIHALTTLTTEADHYRKASPFLRGKLANLDRKLSRGRRRDAP